MQHRRLSTVCEGSLLECDRGAKLQAKLNQLQTEFQEKQAKLTKDLEDARESAAAAEKRAAEAEAERATLAQAVEQEETRALQDRDALKSEASSLAAQVGAALCSPVLSDPVHPECRVCLTSYSLSSSETSDGLSHSSGG